MLRLLRDKIENELVISVFSACMFDMEKVYNSVCVQKSSDEMEYDFDSIYQGLDIYIDYDKVYEIVSEILTENINYNNIGGKLIINPYVKKIIIYNMSDYPVQHIWKMGSWNDVSGDYVSPNNIIIDKTSIYVEMEFAIRGFMGIERKLSMEKCFSLEY